MFRWKTRSATLTLILLFAGPAGQAHGYSTKLHMITGWHIVDMLRKNNCTIPLGDWNQGARQAKSSYLAANRGPRTYTVKLKPSICRIIKKHSQYFVSGTTGPDTFPGMFGNTDPTHALLWNTAWQTQVLWQNAKTGREKAFALGWLVHFAGDLNAHGLANLHAHGIWMQDMRAETVWKHVVTETYYAKFMLPYPKHFNNNLVWPEAFVKKMFFNSKSALYQHYDYLLRKKPKALGAVAKGFGAFYRAMFLLQAFHAREMQKWRGRKDFYRPSRKAGGNHFLHWLVADQVYNLHKKKLEAIEKVIDRWYEGTHRAQQAIVADGEGLFTGKKRYDKIYFTAGHRRVKPGHYASGGVLGVVAAYKYLMEAISDYLKIEFITVTDENAPIFRAVLDAAKKMAVVAVVVIDVIKHALEFIKGLVAQIKAALLAPFASIIKKAKNWIAKKAMCSLPGMSRMCKTIEAQRVAFGVVPGQVDTYLNWPIYRNTITAGALMLGQLQKVPKAAGNETKSPVFGLPSGDFGCTDTCISVRHDPRYRGLFMPMAGKSYRRASTARALPDYCVGSKDRRRTSGLNETYSGKTNDAANGGYTCFRPGAGSCGAGSYAPFQPKAPTGRLGKVYQAVGETTAKVKHPAPRTGPLVRASVGSLPCHRGLAYGPATLVTQVDTPAQDHLGDYRVAGYSLLKYLPPPVRGKVQKVLSAFQTLKALFRKPAQAAGCRIRCAWQAKLLCISKVWGPHLCVDEKIYQACKRSQCN